MIPKGVIWQELRADCLGTITPASRVDRVNPDSLALWQKRGYFGVQRVTSRQFELVTASDDFGTAILADVEHLLDCAAEHQVCLWRHINSINWLSPAWLVVTFYYWAFFLCLALTRLTGRSVLFLNRESTQILRRMGQDVTSAPGAGAYRVLCGAQVSLTDRTVTLSKTSQRIHDGLWHVWCETCNTKLRQTTTGTTNALEERLFTCFGRAGDLLGGPDWPSTFRNIVNYQTGFAYSGVRREQVLQSFSYLRSPHSYGFNELLDRFESNLARVRSPTALSREPQTITKLLVDYTFLLYALAIELHSELLERHSLDRRWALTRERFLRENDIYDSGEAWPC